MRRALFPTPWWMLLGVFSAFSEAVSTEAPQRAQARLTKQGFQAWPRSRVDEFGCFLEKVFGHRDLKFNCSLKKYENKGDPCKNTKAFYEGPAFPNGKASEVHPLIESIDLSWEHGELQSVTLTLKKKVTEPEARRLLKLPESATVEQCSSTATCIVLTGFDHMGAGDVDCEGE